MIEEDAKGNKVAFFTLPRSSYPFTIEYFSVDDLDGAQPIHRNVVEGPGVLYVPPLSTALGRPVWVRTTYPNGDTDEAWPDER